MSGTIQVSDNGILLVTFSGNIVASMPKIAPPISVFAVQPYQYIAGPSILARGGIEQIETGRSPDDR